MTLQETMTPPSLQPQPLSEDLRGIHPVVAKSDVNLAAHRWIKTWVDDFQSGVIRRIDKDVVHMHHESNVRIARIERVSEDVIIGEVVQDSDNGYDHRVPHVAGPYQIEAARQFGTAIAETYYEVGPNTRFLLHSFSIQFHHMAEKDFPLFIIAKVVETRIKRGQLSQMRCLVTFFQQGQHIADIDGNFYVVSEKVFKYMRQRGRKDIKESSVSIPRLPWAA